MPLPQIAFHGTVTSVPPRVRLTRSFDQTSHSHLGYVLGLDGTIGGEQRRASRDPCRGT